MLRLHHDYPSAASLLAVLTLQALADEGVPVAFHGVDVLGLGTTIPATLDDLDEWQRHRDELAQRGWDVPRPRLHPVTLGAHLVESYAVDRGLGAAWRMGCLDAHWRQQRDLGDVAILGDVAERVGLDPDAVTSIATDRPAAVRARREATARRGAGIGGVPVLQVHDTFVSPFVPTEDLRALAAT